MKKIVITFKTGLRQNVWWPRSHLSHNIILSASPFFLQSLQRAFKQDFDQVMLSSRLWKWTNNWDKLVQFNKDFSQFINVCNLFESLLECASLLSSSCFIFLALFFILSGVLGISPNGRRKNFLSTDCSICSNALDNPLIMSFNESVSVQSTALVATSPHKIESHCGSYLPFSIACFHLMRSETLKNWLFIMKS